MQPLQEGGRDTDLLLAEEGLLNVSSDLGLRRRKKFISYFGATVRNCVVGLCSHRGLRKPLEQAVPLLN